MAVKNIKDCLESIVVSFYCVNVLIYLKHTLLRPIMNTLYPQNAKKGRKLRFRGQNGGLKDICRIMPQRCYMPNFSLLAQYLVWFAQGANLMWQTCHPPPLSCRPI